MADQVACAVKALRVALAVVHVRIYAALEQPCSVALWDHAVSTLAGVRNAIEQARSALAMPIGERPPERGWLLETGKFVANRNRPWADCVREYFETERRALWRCMTRYETRVAAAEKAPHDAESWFFLGHADEALESHVYACRVHAFNLSENEEPLHKQASKETPNESDDTM